MKKKIILCIQCESIHQNGLMGESIEKKLFRNLRFAFTIFHLNHKVNKKKNDENFIFLTFLLTSINFQSLKYLLVRQFNINIQKVKCTYYLKALYIFF